MPLPNLGNTASLRRPASRAKTEYDSGTDAPTRPVNAGRSRPTAGIRVVGVSSAAVAAYQPPVPMPIRPAAPRPVAPTIAFETAASSELATVGLILVAALLAGVLSGVVAFHAILG